MKNSLFAAMVAGRNSISHPFKLAADAYDHAGFIAMRAMMDDHFLHIPHHDLPSPHFQKAALAVNGLKGMAREKAVKMLEDTYAHGNVGPKPDIKKPVMKLLESVIWQMPKLHPNHIAVLTVGVGAALLATHFMPDVAATYMSVKPDTKVPSAPDLKAFL